MWRRVLWTMMILSLPVGPVRAVYGFGDPNEAGTTQRVARMGAGDQIELWYGTSRPVYETKIRTEERVVDGETVTVNVCYCVQRLVSETHVAAVDARQVRAYGLDRKLIPSERLMRLLALETPVLLCEHGQKIDAAYLKLVKPDTIVLLLPAPQVAYAVPAAPGVDAPPPPSVDSAPVPPPPRAEESVPPAPAPDVAPAPPAPVPPAPAPAPPVDAAPQPVVEGEAPAPVPAPPAGDVAIDYPDVPTDAQPAACLASIDDGGTLKLRAVQSTAVEVTAMKCDVQADGSQVCRPVSVKRSSRAESTQEIDAAEIQGFTVDGQEIPADELTSRLAKEVPVLVSGDGKAVDPLYLKIIREDAIVLVVPVVQPQAPAFMPPAPAPVPPVEGGVTPPPAT